MLAGNHELSASDSFSLLAFYQGDERSGRTHETWCGTLAPTTIDIGAVEMQPLPTHSIPAPMLVVDPRSAIRLGPSRRMARSY